MGVVNDGHRDSGGGSFADSAFEGSWRGASPRRATVGPLAEWDGRDPLEKSARVIGGDNAFESTSGPGMDRVVQSPDPASEKGGVEQNVSSAKAPGQAPARVAGAPSTGAKGQAADSGTGHHGPADVKEKPGPEKSKSYLTVSDAAPVPRSIFPAPVSPSWTGSGPNASMTQDMQKAASDEEVDGVLFYAKVPMRLSPGGFLRGAAAQSLTKTAGDQTQLLASGAVHPLKLSSILDDYFGSDWHDWDPEVIRTSLAAEAGVEPGDSVMNKVMAVKIAFRRPDVFYDRWQAFEKIAVSLNNHDPSMSDTEELDPEEMANAVTVFAKIAGEGDFSDEVKTYVAAKLYDSGFVVAPPQLAFSDGRLGDMVKNDDLRSKVILAYAKAVKSDDPLSESEDPVSIQVARLIRTHVYVMDQASEGWA